MILFRVAAAAAVLNLSGALVQGAEGRSAHEVIYRAKVAGMVEASQRLVVFDFATGTAGDAELGYLKKHDPKFFGDLGGDFAICSDEKFLCIASESSLRTAIPRNILEARQTDWTYGDLSCRGDRNRFHPNDVAIVCFFHEHFSWVYYTKDRGVVSYTRSLEPDVVYDLVGEKGLLVDEPR